MSILVFSLTTIVTYMTCDWLFGDQLKNRFKGTRAAAGLRWFARNLFGG